MVNSFKLFLASHNKGKVREFRQLLQKVPVTITTAPIAFECSETGPTFKENALQKAQALSDAAWDKVLQNCQEEQDVISKELHYRWSSNLKLPRPLLELIDGWILGDDSGLCVDALKGAPGVYSARYAGEHTSFDQKMQHLLTELQGVPEQDRTAHFTCALVLIHQNDVVFQVSESCYGQIAFGPKGSHGFGFDPIFYLPVHRQTMAELPPEMKNQISHRAQAVQKLSQFFTQV